MVHITTIQISKSTKSRLESLKNHKRESFEEVINKLLVLVPAGDEEGRYTSHFRAGLLEALYESKTGRLIPFDQIKKELKMM